MRIDIGTARNTFTQGEALPPWHLLLETGVAVDVEWVFELILSEMQAAILHHGWKENPVNPQMSHHHRLPILAEEAGEVAAALTYDKWAVDGEAGLMKELRQTAAMAACWLVGRRLRESVEKARYIARGTGYHPGRGVDFTEGGARPGTGSREEEDGRADEPRGAGSPDTAGGSAGSAGCVDPSAVAGGGGRRDEEER